MILYSQFKYFSDEMCKEGNALTRRIRRLAKAGEIEKAKKLAEEAERRGLVRRARKGTPNEYTGIRLSDLGGGAEGRGFLTYGSRDAPAGSPISVMKAFDRDGALYSKADLGEKFNIFRRGKGNEAFAQVYSPKIRRGKKGTPFWQMEHVPGTDTAISRFPRDVAGTVPGKELGVGKKKRLVDIHGNPGNVITTPDGKEKIIDLLPSNDEKLLKFLTGDSPQAVQVRKGLGLPGAVPKVKATSKALDDPAAYEALVARVQQRNAAHLNEAIQSPLVQRAASSQVGALRQAALGNASLAERASPQAGDYLGGGLRRASRKRVLQGL